jgi:hypothetical protein
VQGPDNILYFTTNNQRLGRITTAGEVQPFIETPFTVGDSLATRRDDLWINDFNTRSIWRYDIPTGVFTEPPRRARRPWTLSSIRTASCGSRTPSTAASTARSAGSTRPAGPPLPSTSPASPPDQHRKRRGGVVH